MSVISTCSFADSGPFLGLLLTVLRSRSNFQIVLNPKVRLHVSHQHWQFWPILARFMDYYSLSCGPGVISTINELNPGVRLCAGQQHSQFLSILPRFMAYYSLF